MCNENKTCKITASIGLVAVVLLHVAGLYVAGLALKNPTMHWLPPGYYEDISANTAPVGGYNFDTSIQGQQSPRVPINSAARDEIKKQAPCTGPNCNVRPSGYNLGPGEYIVPGSVRVVDRVVQPGVSQPSYPNTPATPPKNVVSKTATQTKNHLAIFIDGSSFSREVRSWFDSDPSLRSVRDKCYFQEYTASNALYRSRYASLIPPEQFPAVVLMRPDGGHIYVGRGSMLPATASQLYSDMQAAYRLLEQVTKQSPSLPPAQPVQPDWAGQATDEIQLVGSTQSPCDNGQCDQRDRLLPLFPKANENHPLEFLNFSRTNWLDSAAMLIAVSVACLILYRRFAS